MTRWYFKVSCALMVLATSLVDAKELKDEKFGFRVTIPAGFKSDPGLVKGDTLYSYVRPEGSSGSRQVIQIRRMQGTIGRERLETKDVRKLAPQATVTQEKWNSIDVDVLRMPQQMQGVDIIALNAQIPLKHEAIQIGVGGEKSTEAALWQLLRTLLDSLEGEIIEGESNRLSTTARVEKLLDGLKGLVVTVAVIVIVVVWFVRRRRKRRQQLEDRAKCIGEF